MIEDIAIRADSPIRKKEEDLLGRDRMAVRVAEVINRSCGAKNPREESLVVGVEGEWGSGKTSFINLILENLESSANGFLTIKFNPWNFSDQNELVTDFFNSLIEKLKREGGAIDDKGIKSIKDYCSKLLNRVELKIAPKISVQGVEVGFGEIYKTGCDDPLENQKEKINDLLRQTEKRFIIVIDDIDRLDAQETRLVFKLVRMTANFANTVFILAYDRGRVGERISENGLRGEEFLKKIVQLSFPLPRVDQQDLFRILFGELGETMKSFDSKSWEWESWEDFFDLDLAEENGAYLDDLRQRWEDLFESCLKKLFPTVRDIRRYINGLRLDLKIIGREEVNPVDFLGIEAIRIFAPDVYFAMADEKGIFAFPAAERIYGKHRMEPLPFPGMIVPSGTPDEETRKEICEKIIEEKSPDGLADSVREIVRKLFPQVENLYSQEETADKPHDWGRLRRVCSGYIFDRYFSLSKASLILSEESLTDFLATVADRPSTAEKLKKFQKRKELPLFFTGLLDRLKDLDDGDLEYLLVSVFDFTEGIIGVGIEIFDPYNVENQARRLGRQALKRVEKKKRFEFLRRILDSTKNVYRSTWLVGEMNEEIRKYEERRSLNEPLLSREEAGGLKEICVEKIKKAAEDGSLSNNGKLAYVLSRWKEWESEEAVKNFVAELLKTDDGLFCFLRAYWSVDRKSIHKRLIGEFVDIVELDKRINRFDESSLDAEKAVTIELYKRFSW